MTTRRSLAAATLALLAAACAAPNREPPPPAALARPAGVDADSLGLRGGTSSAAAGRPLDRLAADDIASKPARAEPTDRENLYAMLDALSAPKAEPPVGALSAADPAPEAPEAAPPTTTPQPEASPALRAQPGLPTLEQVTASCADAAPEKRGSVVLVSCR